MSEKKNAVNTAETEKVMTKYDLKMQRRKEEAAKAKKEELKGLIIGIVLVAALPAFVLSRWAEKKSQEQNLICSIISPRIHILSRWGSICPCSA